MNTTEPNHLAPIAPIAGYTFQAIEEAQRLQADIVAGLTLTEEKLTAFIKGQHWKPLGYNTFTTWWKSTMTGVPLAKALKPKAVLTMLSEGTTPSDVADSITGVTEGQATTIAAQLDSGMPADTVAERSNDSRQRRAPKAVRAILVEIPADEFDDGLAPAARRQNITVPELLVNLARTYIEIEGAGR